MPLELYRQDCAFENVQLARHGMAIVLVPIREEAAERFEGERHGERERDTERGERDTERGRRDNAHTHSTDVSDKQ